MFKKLVDGFNKFLETPPGRGWKVFTILTWFVFLFWMVQIAGDIKEVGYIKRNFEHETRKLWHYYDTKMKNTYALIKGTSQELGRLGFRFDSQQKCDSVYWIIKLDEYGIWQATRGECFSRSDCPKCPER